MQLEEWAPRYGKFVEARRRDSEEDEESLTPPLRVVILHETEGDTTANEDNCDSSTKTNKG